MGQDAWLSARVKPMRRDRLWAWVAWQFVAVTILLATPFAQALDPNTTLSQYRYRHWYRNEGAPTGLIHKIAQTREGYLWLASDTGLVRFDGQRFQSFDRRNTPAFKSNTIRELCTSEDGVLWIGTASGLIRYENNHFFEVDIANTPVEHRNIRALLCDKSGIYAGTTHSQVFRVESGKAQLFEPWKGPATGWITALGIDSRGRLMIGAWDAGLHRCDAKTCVRIEAEKLPADGLIGNIHPAARGGLWIGTMFDVVLLQDDGKVIVPNFNSAISNDTSFGLLEDRQGTLWIALHNTGLVKVVDDKATIATYVGDNRALLNLRSPFEDAQGNLWLGSSKRGLYSLTDITVASFGVPEGLPDKSAWSIMEDRQGRVWVSTRGGGVHTIRNGTVSAWNNDSEDSAMITSIAQSNDGSLWFGSAGLGMLRWRGNDTPQTVSGPMAPGRDVGALYFDKKNRLWASGFDPGVRYFSGGKWHYLGIQDGIDADTIWSIAEAPDHTIWFGTYQHGLFRYHDNHFTRFDTRDGLASNSITAVMVDSKGHLWLLVRDGGLYTYRDGRFIALGDRLALSTDQLYSLLEDDHGTLWIGSNLGLWRMGLAELEALIAGTIESVRPQLFDDADGIRNVEFITGVHPVAWKARDGVLWFTTTGGAVRVDPKQLKRNTRAPSTILEAIKVDGIVHRSSNTSTIKLGANTRRIEIEFTAIELATPTRLKFRYQLEGVDQDWIEVGGQRRAEFVGLSAGDYRFAVAASLNDGPWHVQATRVEFSINQAWYRSAWFHLALASLITAIVFLIVRYRLIALKAKASSLQLRNNMARELHDTLAQSFSGTLIRLDLAARMVPTDAEQLREQLDIASRETRASFAAMREVVEHMREPSHDRLLLAQLLETRVKQRLQGTEVLLEFEHNGPELELSALITHQLCRIVDETVSNALLHAHTAKLRVHIQIERDAGEPVLLIAVSDFGANGAAALARVQRQAHGGIRGMRERAREIGAEVEFHHADQAGLKVRIQLNLSAIDKDVRLHPRPEC